jgi:hypothetical protein
MSNKQKNPRLISEIIGELKKSSLKNNFHYAFVEGVDDVKIYTEIARKKDIASYIFFDETGGRVPLFELYDTISSKHPALLEKVVFFADKDTFVFNSVPNVYENINFTKGYSIENDMFEDGFHFLMLELSGDEKFRFEQLISNVSEWFAFEVEQIFSKNSKDSKIAISGLNTKILVPHSNELEVNFLSERKFQKADEAFCQQIKNEYKSLLRGKILFELLLRIHFDRNRSGISHKEITSMWNISITEGLRTQSSNCNRILSIFQNRIDKSI